MRQIGYERIGWMLSVVCMGVVPGNARGGEVQSSVDGNAHAKGMVLLRLTFRSQGEVWRAALNTSADGEDYREAGVGRLGIPDLFKSVMYRGGETTILVPAAGWFGSEVSYFDGPGTHWFRWAITFRDQDKGRTEYDQRDYDIEPLVVEQRVEVKPPRGADLDFVERISDPGFIRRLFGDELFDRQSDAERERMLGPSEADLRATAVIGELLKATRGDEPGSAVANRKNKEDIQTWAEAMWTLAQEFPESSYAPYAAYYAGCAYVTLLDNEIREKHGIWTWFSPAARTSPMYERGEKALEFVAEHADSYLKPRAMCMQAALQIRTAAFNQAEGLLEKAAAMGGEGGSIYDLVARTRRDVAKGREDLRRQESEKEGE